MCWHTGKVKVLGRGTPALLALPKAQDMHHHLSGPRDTQGQGPRPTRFDLVLAGRQRQTPDATTCDPPALASAGPNFAWPSILWYQVSGLAIRCRPSRPPRARAPALYRDMKRARRLRPVDV